MSRVINVEMNHHPTLMDIARKVYECYKAGASEIRIDMGSHRRKEDTHESKFEEMQELRQRYRDFFGVELS